MSIPDSFRGVMLSDAIGKRIHAAVRFKIVGQQPDAFLPSQFNCGKGCGSDMCAFVVREHFAAAKRCKLSAGALFVDLVKAYHRLVRQFVVGGDCSAEGLAALVQALGLPASAAEELTGLLDGVSLLRRAGASEHIERAVRQMHCSTWSCGQKRRPSC